MVESLVSNAPAAIVENQNGASRIVLVCEHAGRLIPEFVESLDLDESRMSEHIAWDLGAADLSRALSRLLDAPLVLQRYSRLVYDCNRDFEASDAIVKKSDSVDIPANTNLSEQQKRRRFDVVYQPFETSISDLLSGRRQRGLAQAIVSVHSFTPVYKNQQRSLDLGVLHDADSRFADAVLEAAAEDDAYISARNQPYSAEDGVTHTLITHGIKNNLPNLMLEVRNDLIGTENGQQLWANRLEGLLRPALESIPAIPH